jgi:antitoxin ParD1/3/4
MALNISLPAELEARVRQRVESGLYSSASELVREALRLFETFEAVRSGKLKQLRADLEEGVADVRAGRVVELNAQATKQRGRAKLAKLKSK